MSGRRTRGRAVTYEKYILSKAWRTKRHAKLALSPVCEACGVGLKLHVHHRSYERFGDELMEDLRTLCEGHHTAVHQLAKHVSLAAATDQIIALAPILTAGKVQPARSKREHAPCYGDLRRASAGRKDRPKMNAYQKAIRDELRSAKRREVSKKAKAAKSLASERNLLRQANDRRRAAGRI